MKGRWTVMTLMGGDCMHGVQGSVGTMVSGLYIHWKSLEYQEIRSNKVVLGKENKIKNK
jgi:hypothetical protein